MYWISLVMRVEFAIFGRSTCTLVEVLPYFGCKTTRPHCFPDSRKNPTKSVKSDGVVGPE